MVRCILKRIDELSESAKRKFRNYPCIDRGKFFVASRDMEAYNRHAFLKSLKAKLKPGSYTMEVPDGYPKGFRIIDRFEV